MGDGGGCSVFSLDERRRHEFNDIQKLYSERNYAECEAKIDAFLADHPDCIEVLSIKALVFRNIPSRFDEALAAVKLALKLNIKSDVAWQALGGYHSMEGNYEQAHKSYTRAIALNPRSPTQSNILKDMSRVQLCLRKDFEFLRSCQEMFLTDRNSKLDWMAIPVAVDLCNRPLEAAKILGTWFKLPVDMRSRCTPQWTSQVRVYLCELLEKAGLYDQVIAHLTAVTELETDFRALPTAYTILGRVCLKSGKYELARSSYLKLIETLPQNLDYMIGYMLAHPQFYDVLPSCFETDGVESDDAAKRTCDDSSAKPLEVPMRLYPDSITGQGVRSVFYVTEPLATLPGLGEYEYMQDPASGRLSIAYNRGDLWRLYWQGVFQPGSVEPSTYHELLDLFKSLSERHNNCEALRSFPLAFLPANLQAEAKEILTEMFSKKLKKGAISLIAQMKLLLCTDIKERREAVIESLELALASCDDTKPEYVVEKSLYLASRSVIARRVDNNIDAALTLVDDAINMMPTMIDYYLLKAEYLEDLGEDTCEIREHCYQMNLADKQLLWDAAAQLFSKGDLEKAVELMRGFNAKPDQSGTSEDSRFDTQDQHLELMICHGLLKRGLPNEAARRLHWMVKRLEICQDDVQDFFTYSLRIGNVSPLVEYIRYMRRIFSLRSGQKAMKLLAKIIFNHVDQQHESAAPSAPSSSLASLIEDMPCEIPIKWAMKSLDEITDPLESILVPWLSKFRSDVSSYQSFGILRYSYQLHTRANYIKPYIQAFCLNQSFKISNKKSYHPKFVRIFLHHLLVDRPDKELVTSLLFSPLQNLSPTDYLQEAYSKLSTSNNASHRFDLLCGLEDCMMAERRHQGTLAVPVDQSLLEKLMKSFTEDKEALMATDAKTYQKVIRKLAA